MSTSKPLVIAAFEGWNDAGDAASDAVALIATTWGATPVATLDPELYYDFQVNRPVLERVGDGTTLAWPATRISVATSPVTKRQFLLVQGIEPSMRWRHYCAEILAATAPWEPELVVGVGALLADAPHTRPIPVQTTSEQAAVRERYSIEQSEYTGPVGILSVLAQAADRGIGGMSVWAAVPHYVAQPPSPKATLALLSALEHVLGEPLPVADLVDEARAWQRGVDELAGEDPEISEYVHQLEEAKDTVELPEASGDAIAAEFERSLRRRDTGEGRER